MPHSVRQCKWQLVRLRISQADCQTSLWVPVDQKHFLSGLCQTYSQVRTGRCFANAATEDVLNMLDAAPLSFQEASLPETIRTRLIQAQQQCEDLYVENGA